MILLKTIVIIQARMGSTRLKGKILKPVGDSNVLAYVTRRCLQINGVQEVIVATTTLSQDDVIATWCKENNIRYFRGSENDVLSRFVECAKEYNPDYVMRVTSDCPFVDYEMASEVVELMANEKKEILLVDGELPRGLAVELIAYQALLRINEVGKEVRHREHVTYYAYEFANEFESVTYKASTNRNASNLRITLDTEEDYEVIYKVAQHFNNPLVSSVDVIQFLNNHPEIVQLNAHIEQKPVQ